MEDVTQVVYIFINRNATNLIQREIHEQNTQTSIKRKELENSYFLRLKVACTTFMTLFYTENLTT